MKKIILTLFIVFGATVSSDASCFADFLIPQTQQYYNNANTHTQPSVGMLNGSESNHEWVDLGLSVKWATCNIGAEEPKLSGDYFSWTDSYDVARKEWGESWRMPTANEMRELLNNCTWEWWGTSYMGYIKGTSKRNGNTIIIPACGCKYERYSTEGFGQFGSYWTSSRSNSPDLAQTLYFSKNRTTLSNDYFTTQRNIRAVCK